MQVVVDVREGINKFSHLKEQLSGRQFKAALSRAINRTAMQGRTDARRAVKAEYNIPQKNLNGVNYSKSNPTTLTANIFASSSPIPMDAFSPRFKAATQTITVSRKGIMKARELKRRRRGPVAGLSIEIKKGNRVDVQHAFMVRTAKPRVFARGFYNSSFGFNHRVKRVAPQGNDLPIKPLVTVSVAGAVLNKEVITKIKTKVTTVFEKNIEHELKHKINTLK